MDVVPLASVSSQVGVVHVLPLDQVDVVPLLGMALLGGFFQPCCFGGLNLWGLSSMEHWYTCLPDGSLIEEREEKNYLRLISGLQNFLPGKDSLSGAQTKFGHRFLCTRW